MDQDNFLTEAKTSAITTLSRATINRKVAAGDFPQPVYISARRKAWKKSWVRQWMADQGTRPRCSLIETGRAIPRPRPHAPPHLTRFSMENHRALPFDRQALEGAIETLVGLLDIVDGIAESRRAGT